MFRITQQDPANSYRKRTYLFLIFNQMKENLWHPKQKDEGLIPVEPFEELIVRRNSNAIFNRVQEDGRGGAHLLSAKQRIQLDATC